MREVRREDAGAFRQYVYWMRAAADIDAIVRFLSELEGSDAYIRVSALTLSLASSGGRRTSGLSADMTLVAWDDLTQTVGAGPCSIHGDLADQYSQLTGVEMDERRMSYCRLLEMTKSLIIGAASASDLAHGGTDLRLLSVAALSSAGQPILAALEVQLEEFLEA